ncbi:amino acid ABC transporter ATP-binding protein, partial [Candidatus Uhrbacteria bacterium]|nr:amino acid ABC transporter ATP-binding protein [Candidatus Uhrbacteria bacterium]
AGKTTLLRCIALLEKIDGGEIAIDGHVISSESSKSETEGIMKESLIGFVFQELNPWPHFTVLKNLTKPLTLVKKMSEKDAKKVAMKFLKMVGLEGRKDQFPSFLSGGQKRRLIIARTLIMDPKILLLDEITANLDHQLKSEIFNLIRDIAGDKTMVIVSHDAEMVKDLITKEYVLSDGVLTKK